MRLLTVDEAKEKQGSILLVVLGVLALLSLLGTALVMMTGQQEQETRQFLEKSRAQFASESGVETALAKIMSYNGSMTNLSNDFASIPANSAMPLDFVSKSSFGTLDMDGDGLNEIAGSIGDTYGPNSDRFKLRVESAQSKLNINDSNLPLNVDTDPYEDQIIPERDYSKVPSHLKNPLGRDPDWCCPGDADFNNLKNGGLPYPKAKGRLENLLSTLADVLFPGKNKGPAVSTAILTARDQQPSKAFENWEAVEDALVGGKILDKEQFRILKAHLTLKSWQDENVLRPSFQCRINIPNYALDEGVVDSTGGKLVLTAPAGGNSYSEGDTCAITWNSSDPTLGGGKVNLALYDEDNFISVIGFNLPDNGTFSWAIPSGIPAKCGYRIRILKIDWTVGYMFCHSGMIAVNTTYSSEAVMDPKYSHVKYWPGDGETELTWGGLGAGLPRPKARPQLDDSNNKDIYFFSDAQTKYFEKDARCPIDVNCASRSLLTALIRPLEGWYLKEAPEKSVGVIDPGPVAEKIILGGPASSDDPDFAEDWSQVCMIGPPMVGYSFYMPWDWARRLKCIQHSTLTGGEFQYYGVDAGVDVIQYYYYDTASAAPTHYDIPSGQSSSVYADKNKRFGYLNKAKFDMMLAGAVAGSIYNRIHSRDNDGDGKIDYNPFRTWQEFEDFLYDLCGDDKDLLGLPSDPNYLPKMNRILADLLIANFNPNARINDYNPNKNLFLNVDKSQLIVNTTEFCFQPMGYLEIVSLGEVVDAGKKTLSKDKIRTAVHTHEFFRVTTQEQFMRGFDPASGITAASFFSASNGFLPTAGAAGAFSGHALQSYPEPDVTAKNWIQENQYDGYLMFAVNKPLRDDLMVPDPVFYPTAPAPALANRFFVNFDMTLDAAYVESGPKGIIADNAGTGWKLNNSYDVGLIEPSDMAGYIISTDPQAKMPGNHPGIRGLLKTPKDYVAAMESAITEALPGNLHADGALADTGRALVYAAQNIGSNAWAYKSKWYNKDNQYKWGRRGSMQFWIKPNFNTAHANRIRNFFSVTKNIEMPAVPPYPSPWNSMTCNSFGLFYFAHGGPRVPRPLSSDAFAPELASEIIPTRNMFFHMGNHWEYSTTIDQSWRTDEDPMPGSIRAYNFESHQWSHLALSWLNNERPTPYLTDEGGGYYETATGDGTPNLIRLSINGTEVEEVRAFFSGGLYDNGGALYHNIPGGSTVPSNYARFGESTVASGKNFVADSTYSDIISSATVFDFDVLTDEYDYGRYYGEDDAVYLSPSFNVFSETGTLADELKLDFISWTAYWPNPGNANYKANDPRFNQNRDDANSDQYDLFRSIPNDGDPLTYGGSDPMFKNGIWPEDWVPFSVDIFDVPAGKWYYADLDSKKHLKPNYAGGSMDAKWKSNPLVYKPGQNFSFKVHFNIDPNQTLYTSPAFDDITFGFRISPWNVLIWEIGYSE